MSGPRTFDVLRHVFQPQGRRIFPAPFSSYPGTIHDPETRAVLDQVLVTTFLSPASYTGEDLAEIGVHGNPIVLSSVLSGLFRAGAFRRSRAIHSPGFLNGMDLLDTKPRRIF
jgi:tRNA modification GTPase